jgi:hypothetical protein
MVGREAKKARMAPSVADAAASFALTPSIVPASIVASL